MADRKSRAPRGDWRSAAHAQAPNGTGVAPARTPNKNPYSGLTSNAIHYGYQDNGNSSVIGDTSMDVSNSDQMLSVDNIDKAKIHRRFSVRLNGPPQLDLHDAPNLPMNAKNIIQNELNQQEQRLPKQHAQSAHQLQQASEQQQRPYALTQKTHHHNKYISIGNIYDEELSQLSDRAFDAPSFIKENLSNATAIKIDEFSKKLNKLSLQVEDNIKDVINQSLENLSKTSKDFNETELQIKSLKAIFNELNEVVQSMKETADLRISREREGNYHGNSNNRDRSSILVLQKLWDKELQSLFNHVAGAQQLISAVPGRHVLAESGKWSEVNPTTMKALQSVHLFVLNDHLLVASKRRLNDDGSSNSGGSKYNKSQGLIATQCWPLRDVRMFDLKAAPNSGNDEDEYYMVKISHQSSKFVYRTERYDHYTKILNAYRRGKDEIRTVAENDRASKSQVYNGGSVSRTHSQIGSHRSTNKERRSSGILTKGHQRTRSLDLFTNNTIISMKSLDDNIDELDIQISRKNYGEAIILYKAIDGELGKLGSKKNDAQIEEITQILDNLKFRLNTRKSLIVEELDKKFVSSTAKLSDTAIKELVSHYSALGMIDYGRNIFLKSRNIVVGNLIDRVEINGIIPDFITQISIIRFQVIKHTIKLYEACFRDEDEDQSCFLVDWCFTQVKQHAKFLDQQLNGVDSESINYVDCIKVTRAQVDELKAIGIDVGFLLEGFYKGSPTVRV